MADARFCMACGKERPAAEAAGAPPPPPAAPPRPGAAPPFGAPPPPFAPPPAAPPYAAQGTYASHAPHTGAYGPPPAAPPGAPAAPGPAAVFLRRVFTGDWAGSALAALWPVGLLLLLAICFSVPSWGSGSGSGDADLFGSDTFGSRGSGDDGVPWSGRFQVVIAFLVQGLGGTLEVAQRSSFGTTKAGGSISFWLLTMTVLWIVAVILGSRWLRRARPAGAGPDAALRIGLLAGVAVLVLGLYGQPEENGAEVSTTPVLAALFTFALTAVLSGVVLARDTVLTRLGPGARMVLRACGTALRAAALAVGLWSAALLAVFVYLGNKEGGLGGWSFVTFLAVVVNAALVCVGGSWGADLSATFGLRGDSGGGDDYGLFGYGNPGYSSGRSGFGRSHDFGLSDAGDLWGGWAQAGIVAMGVLCALSLTLMIVRRSREGRKEQVLSGVFFLAAMWLLGIAAGISVELKGGSHAALIGTFANTELGVNGGELFLFGMLWTAGAVLLAVLLSSGRGTGGTFAGPYGPPPGPPAPLHAPYAPPMGAPGSAPGMPPVAPAASPGAPPVTPPPVPPAGPPAGAPVSPAGSTGAGAAAGDTPPAGAPTSPGAPIPAGAPSAAGPPASAEAPTAVERPTASEAPTAVEPPTASEAPTAVGQSSVGEPPTTVEPLAAGGAGPSAGPAGAAHAEPPTAVDPAPPAGPAAPAPARGRALRWAAVGAAAFVVGGVAAAGVLLVNKDAGKDGGKDDRASRQSASHDQRPDGEAGRAAASASPAPSDSPSAGPATPSATASGDPAGTGTPSSTPDVPAGVRTAAPDAHEHVTDPTRPAPKYYELTAAPEGFALAVPEGWRREDKGSGQIDWHGPTGPEHLRVGIVKKADQPAYEHFGELERTVAKEDGYRRLQLTRNTFKGRPGALWEWTWNDHGRTMHAVNQAYVDASGTEYAILYQGREDMGGQDGWHRTFDTALDHWTAGKD
ncbi:hypothetical protein ACQEVS_15645 [Streptomyces sp. CA-181903]|uniref:hypothetical protein n=1 Tax=Streptomyces sp. CA-181903 TaxID=3240055 RepID=UPI003D9469D1